MAEWLKPGESFCSRCGERTTTPNRHMTTGPLGLCFVDPGCGLGECQREGKHVPSCPLWRRPGNNKGGAE